MADGGSHVPRNKAQLIPNFIRSLIKQFVALIGSNALDPLPIRHDLVGYGSTKLKADLRAGTNVALLGIPQGMAYAVIAEVPIYYGITCGAVAAIVAALFSGSRHTILGPTNATSFMVFSFFATMHGVGNFKVEILPLLVFFVGILLIVGAYFRVADLIQYISRSVVVGYISGAALLIIANQLRQVFGLQFGIDEERPRTFFGIVSFLIRNLTDQFKSNHTFADWLPVLAPFSLSLLAGALFFLFKKTLKGWPVFALTLVIVTAAYAGFSQLGFKVEVFPQFGLDELRPNIPKFTEDGIFEDLNLLFSVAFSIAFLAALENSVMSKTLGSISGDRPDQNQDMFSAGISNLVTSFFSVLPSSGSLTRSQLNFSSGAVTRFASIFAGLMCALGAVLLANPKFPVITFVPRCALAALVICIAISLISLKNIRICLRTTAADAITMIVTFVGALILPLHVAIFLGVGVSIMFYLHKASRPELIEYDFTDEGELSEQETGQRQNPLISIVHVEGELFFGAADLFRSQIQRTCSDPNLKVIVLRMRNARRLDATSVMALEELIHFLQSRERHIIISGATLEVAGVLNRSGVIDTLGAENMFMDTPRNPNLSTRDALKRAQVLLGTKEAEVRIFYDPNAPKPD